MTYFCLGERLLRDGNCLAGDLQRRYSAFFALLLTAGTQTGAMQNAGLYSSRQSAKKDLIFTFKKCRKRRETFDNFPNVCNWWNSVRWKRGEERLWPSCRKPPTSFLDYDNGSATWRLSSISSSHKKTEHSFCSTSIEMCSKMMQNCSKMIKTSLKIFCWFENGSKRSLIV